ncbi:MAG: phospholipase [Muribaculaceae bacterium]|nr:phospholipase [Muribaculaceae bacterium]
MSLSLILLAVIVGVGALLYIEHSIYMKKSDRQDGPDISGKSDPADSAGDEECCGMHITCEKDSLLASVSSDVVYYDDEELDRFAGRHSDEYSEAEIEEFRDVLLTLLPDDIAGWGRSLQLRHIELPTQVRDELIMIVAEARQDALKK